MAGCQWTSKGVSLTRIWNPWTLAAHLIHIIDSALLTLSLEWKASWNPADALNEPPSGSMGAACLQRQTIIHAPFHCTGPISNASGTGSAFQLKTNSFNQQELGQVACWIPMCYMEWTMSHLADILFHWAHSIVCSAKKGKLVLMVLTGCRAECVTENPLIDINIKASC